MAKIGIVGWGIEAQSAYRFFGPDNEYLIANEEPSASLPDPSEKIKVQYINSLRRPGLTGNVTDLSYLEGIDKCDKVIYSVTAVKNLEKLYPPDDAFWSKAVTVQHIFFETVKTQNIIGVTGTKGKGTTSTLIAKLLEAGGKKVHLGGNIGRSVLDFVEDIGPDDWVVLELSNFQLYRLPFSPHIAVCLMIASEHMDWHPDMADYINAKSNIFKHQKPEDIAVYFASNDFSKQMALLSAGQKIPYYKKPGAFLRSDGQIVIGEDERPVIHKTQVRLIGEHNLQNVCAAITAVWPILQDVSPMKRVLSEFSGLEHRLEFVKEVNGVKYYDDSFGTNPDTTIVALRAFREPKVLILGGIDKGLPFDNLINEITKSGVRHVVLIGQTSDKLAKMLSEHGYNSFSKDVTAISDIVASAQQAAQPGDVVLLSTAASSFDLFKDYKDRGNQFKKAVQALA